MKRLFAGMIASLCAAFAIMDVTNGNVPASLIGGFIFGMIVYALLGGRVQM